MGEVKTKKLNKKGKTKKIILSIFGLLIVALVTFGIMGVMGKINVPTFGISDLIGKQEGPKGVAKEQIREKLKKRHQQYYKNKQPEDLKDKIVIIIDDGIATGNTIRVTAELVYAQKPKKVIVAIPVAPGSAIKSLEDSSHIDQVICLQTPYDFMAVGQFYEFFNQVSDEEAIELLEESNQAS